ncbi:MAG: hypothetical protein RJB66_2231 [Pseudomonadota bacterium]
MPADPSTEESFDKIKQFYKVTEGLPKFVVSAIENKTSSKFVLQTVRLKAEGYPEISMVMKFPSTFRPPLSALVLFTGFQTGSDAINLVGDPENSVYVGFQYPWPFKNNNGLVQWDWTRMQMIPLLMSVGLAWLHQQPYIDNKKINVITVSFGTLFYPLAQRFLNQEGYFSRATVFGYGGVDIAEVIGGELIKNMGSNELEVSKLVIRQQTWFLEPKNHVSHLKGPFLVVNGESDTVFPPQSQSGLFDNLKEPKKLVTLPGAHIQPDKPEIISAFMGEVKKFIAELNAL